MNEKNTAPTASPAAPLPGAMDVKTLFKEALSWGLVYGTAMAPGQWEELSDKQASLFAQRFAPTVPPAEAEHIVEWRDDANGFTRSPHWVARPAAPMSEVQLPELPPDGVVKAMQDAWWSGKSAHIMKTTDAYRVYAAIRSAMSATPGGGK